MRSCKAGMGEMDGAGHPSMILDGMCVSVFVCAGVRLEAGGHAGRQASGWFIPVLGRHVRPSTCQKAWTGRCVLRM